MLTCCRASCCSTPADCTVLDSPEAIHAFPNTPSDAIEHTLAFLAENYQFVIVDCPPGLSEDTCAAIRQSDRLAIVITPELPAIHNAIRSIEYLTGLHYPDENIDIVLNRYSRKSPLSEREIEASLHRQIAVKIPNDYDLIVNAINAGTPIDLARKSDTARGLRHLGGPAHRRASLRLRKRRARGRA